MDADPKALPDDVDALRSVLLATLAELAVAKAMASEDQALIAHQRLRIAKLERQVYGQRSERSVRLIDQMELTFEELEAAATEDEIAAEHAVAKTTTVAGFTRKRPAERNTFPEHLPRERVVIEPPTACECCGGIRLRKLGEDVTQTLESIPRQWKVVETVREKFTCRDCEKIAQAPAPFHVIPRGWAGPSLLAMILFEKFGQHQPLNRQVERYAREGVPISLSTAADAVGAACAVLEPLLRLVEAHVMAAERLHGDDTTVPVLALGKCDVGRCWTYVRDDRPFGGPDPPAAMFYYSRNRKGEHPQAHLANYSGILQADAFDGYAKLYEAGRTPGPIQEAACWVHARRPFFAMADLEENARRKAAGKKEIVISPMAIEIVRRIDALFEIERDINGQTAQQRRAVRQALSAPLVADLHTYMREQCAKLSRGHDLAKAMNYMLKRWPSFTRFLDDGRICLSNNAAERALRGIALGRKSWLFCGSDRGGHVQPDRHRQNERRRSSGLAGRRARPHRHPPRTPARRTPALDLEARKTASPIPGGLTMQRNKVHHVHTVARVAKDLGVDEDLIHELTLGLEPEDGVIWVYGVDDGDGTLAFTDEGVEEVQFILMEYSRIRSSKS